MESAATASKRGATEGMDLQQGYRIAQWRVLPDRNLVSGPNGSTRVSARAMDVLCHLARHSREVVSREEFSASVWEDVVVTDDALTGCISELRRALGDTAAHPRYIETIPKRGYRLLVDPEALSDRNRTSTSAVAVAAAIVLLCAMAFAAWQWLRPAAPVSDASIAVLPFEVIGTDAPFPLADGLHHDLLTRLSAIEDLRVISSTSVRQFRDTELTVPEIAELLDVAWIMEGAVQQVGDRIRLNAQLIEAATDTHRWAHSYEHELSPGKLLEIQVELIEDIASSLAAELDPRRAHVQRPYIDDLEAYSLSVRGRSFADLRTEAGMQQATVFFRRALEVDPNFAPAWLGLADALTLLHDYGYAEPEATLPEAEAAIRKALSIDPELGAAHASQGILLATQRQVPAAIKAFERAIERQPGYAEAHNWLAWISLVVGRVQSALPAAETAVELDPLSSEALSNLSLARLASGDAEGAIEVAQRSTRLGLSFSTDRFYEALAHFRMGRFERTIELLDGLEAAWAGEGPRATLALAHVRLGERTRARRILDELDQVADPFAAGLVLAALGKFDEAFEYFERLETIGYWPALAMRFLYPDLIDALSNDRRFDRLEALFAATYGLNDEV
jgi:TolB-like protein/DNA-binding winged helix-turn-helix (wHTH) protein/Tfp pilus assembly protein PilF